MIELLSPHFSLAECTRSDTAARMGIDNNVPPLLLGAAKETARMMERIRAHLCKVAGRDVSIHISSWYRCPQLNTAVGSKPTSDHIKAVAVDWVAPGFGTPTEIAQELATQMGPLGIGQLINEFPDRTGWVHTSLRAPDKAINRIITITSSGVVVGIKPR